MQPYFCICVPHEEMGNCKRILQHLRTKLFTRQLLTEKPGGLCSNSPRKNLVACALTEEHYLNIDFHYVDSVCHPRGQCYSSGRMKPYQSGSQKIEHHGVQAGLEHGLELLILQPLPPSTGISTPTSVFRHHSDPCSDCSIAHLLCVVFISSQ